MAFEHNQSIKLITKVFRRKSKRNSSRKQDGKKVKSQVLGGVYYHDASVGSSNNNDNHTTLGGLKRILEKEHESSKSLTTVESTDREDDGILDDSWRSSGSSSHHDGAPLLVRRAVSQRHLNGNLYLSDEELLGRIMIKAKKLPKSNTGYLVSNHVMINNERTKRTRVPLKRNPSLDEIAREHAAKMASKQCLAHPDLENLPSFAKRLGANVGRGSGVEDIHRTMMSSESDKNNIIDRRFVSMGAGTAKSADGTLYLCQIFED